MGFDINKIQDIQLDVLKEIGNIGAGHAATALSKMIDKKVDMNVPNVKVIPFSEIEEVLGEEDQVVVGIFLRLEGDICGNIFYMMSFDSAKLLINNVLKMESSDNTELSEIEISVLHELGNILAGSYISSLADFTKLNIYPSVPAMTVDLVGAIFSYGLIQISQYTDAAILIETRFKEGDNFLEGHFFLLPDPEAFSTLFNSIGVPIE